MKEWKELTLTDDYLFSQIMKDEEFCKLFLEMLMGIKIQFRYSISPNIALLAICSSQYWKASFYFLISSSMLNAND